MSLHLEKTPRGCQNTDVKDKIQQGIAQRWFYLYWYPYYWYDYIRLFLYLSPKTYKFCLTLASLFLFVKAWIHPLINIFLNPSQTAQILKLLSANTFCLIFCLFKIFLDEVCIPNYTESYGPGQWLSLVLDGPRKPVDSVLFQGERVRVLVLSVYYELRKVILSWFVISTMKLTFVGKLLSHHDK